MKRTTLYLLLFLCTHMAYADLLTELLNNDYAAQTLTISEQDSILNPSTRQRYRLDIENKRQLFRHSFEADYYLVDTEKHTRTHLSDGPVRDAQISPNEKYVVYAKANNLYIYKIDFKTELAITDNDNPEIISGTADWLYEEEFGITRLFEFSPDSKSIAFVRLNETNVPTFCWQEMLDEQSNVLRYPKQYCLRYPKAGEPNAQAEICVYDILYKTLRVMQTGDLNDGYMPRIAWTHIQPAPTKKDEPIPAELIVEKINRDQNCMEILLCNTKSTICRTLYKEQSDRYYVDYAAIDEWTWLSDNRFIAVSEQSGWRQIYLYSADGTWHKQLTHDGMDVTAVYGVDEKLHRVYFQAAPTPMERQAYYVDWKSGDITALTTDNGWHDLRFADDMKHYIDCYQSVETPNVYTLCSNNGKVIRELLNNNELKQRWQDLDLPRTEFTTITTERGDVLNAYTIKPRDMVNDRKYPVVLLQYSGPGSQRVLNKWRKRWGTYLAEQGYIVVNADGRGTGGRGRAWCNETYMQLGKKEAEDQISVARYMATLPYVDKDQITMIGWSYGGFQTIRTMCEEGSPIRRGVAIAPVIDWRLYDSAYTERYMRRPQVNDTGYDNADLTRMADQLQGRLLLVHGLADDNVHAQNSLLFIDALVRAGKQFDMQLYPDDNHFLRKRSNYEHLHRRIMEFLKQP